jgi:hypothetical protein
METILEKFPNWQTEIQLIHQENADFQEMCADYEEIQCLFTNWTEPTDITPAIIVEYRGLLKKLEAEIMEALQTRFQAVQSSEQ